ncbi:MAG: tetratricopeptide repeat protein, partial [Thermodesulfobacteriota bacterium]
TYTNRGIALGSSGRFEAAIEDLTEAVSIEPGMRMAWYNRALATSALGRYREAIADLTRAIEIDPGYAEAYHNRGVAHANLAQYGEAIEDFKSSVAIRPSAAAYMNLATAYRMAGRAAQAEESLREAARLGTQ